MAALVRCCATGDEVRREVAAYVAALSAASGDRFVVALSGGSMPSLLTGLAARRDIDFAKWHIFFADERCVPLDAAESNYRACREALFSHLPDTVTVHTVDPSLEPAAAADAYEAAFRRCGGRLDLALLGAGPDGHTASLFPGHPLFDEPTERLVAPILDSPKPPPRRVTFTLPALLAARHVAFLATGAGKADLFATLFVRSPDDAAFGLAPEPPHLPITLVTARHTAAAWFIDAAAASKIHTQ
mmetsp:Transcript_12681/g.40216  ORF Transcript_12681/g.40216 Transcript_12681/m.40216 type:complete len:244 (-) Transcript_12681:58-789(-)